MNVLGVGAAWEALRGACTPPGRDQVLKYSSELRSSLWEGDPPVASFPTEYVSGTGTLQGGIFLKTLILCGCFPVL